MVVAAIDYVSHGFAVVVDHRVVEAGSRIVVQGDHDAAVLHPHEIDLQVPVEVIQVLHKQRVAVWSEDVRHFTVG